MIVAKFSISFFGEEERPSLLHHVSSHYPPLHAGRVREGGLI